MFLDYFYTYIVFVGKIRKLIQVVISFLTYATLIF